MKIKYILFSLLLFTIISMESFSQRPSFPSGIFGTGGFSPDKVIPDTITNGFEGYTPTIFSSPNGGYMNGTNGYGDLAKGEEFKLDSSYIITHVLYWFAVKNKTTGGDTSKVIFNIYEKDSVQLVANIQLLVPNSIMASDSVSLANLNAGANMTDGLNVFTLPAGFVVTSNYVCGFDLSRMNPKDSVAIFSSSDDETIAAGRSWEKQFDHTWKTIAFAWGLNVDFAIFPVLDLTNAGIENVPFMNQLKASIFPNPASENCKIKLELQQAGEVELYIVDSQGKNLIQSSKGHFEAGVSEISQDITKLSSGTYFLGLKLNENKPTFQKLTVIK